MMKKILAFLLLFCLLAGTAYAEKIAFEEQGPIVLVKGESVQLHITGSAAKLTWSSTKKTVATVDQNGNVTAVAEGKTTIRVNKSASIEVQVRSRTDEEVLMSVTDSDQVCLVRYKKGSNADFSFWEKTDGEWKETFSCGAYVGKKGIGKTKEGDSKTPTGAYHLTMAFGILENPGALMDYHQVTETDYWCSNTKSEYYNLLVDTAQVNYKPVKADEHLIKVKRNYNYCLALDYNAECVAGKGSAIFLHCTGKNRYTSGCIAIPEKYMVQLLQALRPGGMIVIFD